MFYMSYFTCDYQIKLLLFYRIEKLMRGNIFHSETLTLLFLTFTVKCTLMCKTFFFSTYSFEVR